jgi:antagonist of KipI
MSISVLKPGMQSSFQDLGRTGYQHLGIPVAGVMDTRAHQLANLLVGNDTDMASLEITLTGPTLRLTQACCIALCGADLSATLNRAPVVMNRPLVVRPGDELSFGARQSGTRTYLAIHGGFDIPRVLGSQSTFIRSSIGGFEGRALKRGDEIGIVRPLNEKALDALARDLWAIKIYLPSAVTQTLRSTVRIVTSMQWLDFTESSRHFFMNEPFRIRPESERMGYRLQGPHIALSKPRQMISEATTFGTIQVPAGGDPIVLMADRQTTGGYPKIAYIAHVDLPLLAQMGPGDTLRFEIIALEQAQELDRIRTQAFAALRTALAPLRSRLLEH